MDAFGWTPPAPPRPPSPPRRPVPHRRPLHTPNTLRAAQPIPPRTLLTRGQRTHAHTHATARALFCRRGHPIVNIYRCATESTATQGRHLFWRPFRCRPWARAKRGAMRTRTAPLSTGIRLPHAPTARKIRTRQVRCTRCSCLGGCRQCRGCNGGGVAHGCRLQMLIAAAVVRASARSGDTAAATAIAAKQHSASRVTPSPWRHRGPYRGP